LLKRWKLYLKIHPESEKFEILKKRKDWKKIQKTLKHISAMAGIREKDIEIDLEKTSIQIHAKRGSRNYHARILQKK